MYSTTLPGTLQIRVMADRGDAEKTSKLIKDFLTANKMKVIDLTPDFADKHNPDRVKFFVVAIPGGEPVMDHKIIGSSEG